VWTIVYTLLTIHWIIVWNQIRYAFLKKVMHKTSCIIKGGMHQCWSKLQGWIFAKWWGKLKIDPFHFSSFKIMSYYIFTDLISSLLKTRWSWINLIYVGAYDQKYLTNFKNKNGSKTFIIIAASKHVTSYFRQIAPRQINILNYLYVYTWYSNCWNSGKALRPICQIWQARDLNSSPSAHKAIAPIGHKGTDIQSISQRIWYIKK